MNENTFNCVWWEAYVCTKDRCDEICEEYVDALSENGKFIDEDIQNQFNYACEKVREMYRNDVLKGKVR